MTETDTSTGSLVALSTDYSDDELDAIALLFDRPLLAARRRATGAETAVERAVNEAALRALVARRALSLEGPGRRPRVRLLEPHRSLLDPFVGADATIAVWVHRPGRVSATAHFLRGDRGVEQSAVGNQAIKRMTLRPRAATLDATLDAIALDELTDAEGKQAPFELSPRTWSAAEEAVAEDEDPTIDVPAGAVDLLYARTLAVDLSVTRREGDGTLVRERLQWMAAGLFGTWLIEPDEGEPPATVTLEPVEAERVRQLTGDLVTSTVGSAQTG